MGIGKWILQGPAQPPAPAPEEPAEKPVAVPKGLTAEERETYLAGYNARKQERLARIRDLKGENVSTGRLLEELEQLRGESDSLLVCYTNERLQRQGRAQLSHPYRRIPSPLAEDMIEQLKEFYRKRIADNLAEIERLEGEEP